MSPKLNCAGQGCPERDGCRRFEARIPDGVIVVRGVEHQKHEWASFDIERSLTGDCKQRIAFRPAYRQAA